LRKCPTCGETKEIWEKGCVNCDSDDLFVFAVGSSLRYRLTTGLIKVSAFILASLLIMELVKIILKILPHVLSGTPLIICQIVIAITGVLIFVVCITCGYISLTEIRSNASYAISKTKISFSNIKNSFAWIDDEIPKEPKLTLIDSNMADVGDIRVKQGWLGRHLDYGEIDIYMHKDLKPTIEIPGVIRPYIFIERFNLLLNRTVNQSPISMLESQSVDNNQENINSPTQKTIKKLAFTILALASLSFGVLSWVGGWYRSTIPEWDECIKNNECFVCHAPAQAQEGTLEDIGENVRLCPEHSTMWYSMVYGLPACIFIFQDAPWGTGWLLQPIIRGVEILCWFVGLLLSGLGILLALAQLILPSSKILLRLM
jgi:hypothetical protein